jgi:hypothetical protein
MPGVEEVSQKSPKSKYLTLIKQVNQLVHSYFANKIILLIKISAIIKTSTILKKYGRGWRHGCFRSNSIQP